MTRKPLDNDNMMRRQNATKIEVVFDNGGGITLQSDQYTHTYQDARQAATDARALLAGADPSDWEGNLPGDRAQWTPEEVRNGGYRVYTAEDLEQAQPHASGWHNENDFLAALREAR